MGEFTKNIETEPMGWRQRARVRDLRVVLDFLTQRHTGTAEPFMSDHYHAPEPLVTVEPIILERTDVAQLEFDLTTQTTHGFDIDGNYR